ncbi:hypothetical protein LVD13_11805 [Flavobacteriaceae bacterium D16]|nr:hypothetical protein [Flavobacteriaceae bacterium D16]
MKYTFTIMVVILFGMSGCSSQKKLVEQAPFSVEKPSCTPFEGGLEASGSGFVLQLPISTQAEDEITFEKVFFRGHILNPEWVTEEGNRFLQCRYMRKGKEKPDIIMHDDPMMEVGNQPPGEIVEKEEFPFKLKPDEAVIAYRLKGKTVYTKISGIKEKSPLIYPSRQNN